MSAHFCGVNTPTIANFKLLTLMSLNMDLGRHVHFWPLGATGDKLTSEHPGPIPREPD